MDITLDNLLKISSEFNATDIHVTVGAYPAVRRLGEIITLDQMGKMTSENTHTLVKACLSEEKLSELTEYGEVDSSFSKHGVGRYRVNVYKQRGSYAMALRVQPFRVPDINELNLPKSVRQLVSLKSGLVLITGATGSGKSTTLASLINEINKISAKHIITIEDPIEYLHSHNKSLVNQREVGIDSNSFASALRAALREDPDVILVGEMRDLETTSIAITAAETGHLVFSTMHTLGASKTIDRILDIFPSHQQNQIKSQLSTVLKSVVTQQLIPRKDGQGMVAACEVMKSSPAISNLIREGKTYQIPSVIQMNFGQGMQTMNDDLNRLIYEGKISRKQGINYALDKKELIKQIDRGF